MTAERTTVSLSAASVFRGALVLIGLYALYILRDLVLVLLTAVVIASAIDPAARWFMRKRVPRLLGVIVIYFLIAAALFSIFYFVIPPLLEDLSGFLSQLPDYLRSLAIFESVEQLQSFDAAGSQEVVDSLRGGLISPDIISGFSNILTSIPGGVFSTVSTVFGGVLSFVLIIVISFYLSVQETGIDDLLRIVLPVKHQKYGIDLWRRSQRRIGRWMQGQVLLMIIVGVLVYLGLTILGIRQAFLFAILAAMFELIPLFGPILSSIPPIAVAFADEGLTLALIVAGVYIIIQQFENHLIYPLVVHKVVGVPALLVIIALVVGAQLAGFLGILLAVPIATALMEFVNDVRDRKKALVEAGINA